ncbi:MAG: adenine deaminase [Bacteroidetes bacterium]|nr:adenine deaminase [Bacteroidota bacterium]
MNNEFSISGNIVDLISQRIFQGTITVKDDLITTIIEEPVEETQYILPGLIDAHIHIESSMLIPAEFARMAVVYGTVASVSDPHEIANVLGIDGVKYMIKNGDSVPFKFFFGAPSCVPATEFESSGAVLGVSEIEKLLALPEIKYLSEMMNFPGVIFGDKEVAAKISLAKKYNKPIDGHAPGLTGNDMIKYVKAGITTDHECFTLEEALQKINHGMKVLIREGSAAKNFEALIPLLNTHPDEIMFCSDDLHPNDLVKGHINKLIKRAIKKGYDPLTVLKCCIYNPIKHYNLEVGLLQKNDSADFIVVDSLTRFNIEQTYINGKLVADKGKSLIETSVEIMPNHFVASPINKSDIAVTAKDGKIKVIEALEGQLITNKFEVVPTVIKGFVVSDPMRDVLKMVVLNRYQKSKPAIGFIKNFGFKTGAIASTVAHDSHNIIAIGVDDHDIVEAINILIKQQGGISLVNKDEQKVLSLPVAGIMSNRDAQQVAADYEELEYGAKKLGSSFKAPFMTLSFMALLVIPALKLSDRGLFDGDKFELIDLFS